MIYNKIIRMFGFWCKDLDKYKLDVKMLEV
jgi:hypothetical protein